MLYKKAGLDSPRVNAKKKKTKKKAKTKPKNPKSKTEQGSLCSKLKETKKINSVRGLSLILGPPCQKKWGGIKDFIETSGEIWV